MEQNIEEHNVIERKDSTAEEIIGSLLIGGDNYIHEIVVIIFSYFPFSTLRSFLLLNRTYYNYMMDKSAEEWLWIPFYNTNFVNSETYESNLLVAYQFPYEYYLKECIPLERQKKLVVAKKNFQQHYIQKATFSFNKWNDLKGRIQHAQSFVVSQYEEPLTFFKCIVRPKILLTIYFKKLRENMPKSGFRNLVINGLYFQENHSLYGRDHPRNDQNMCGLHIGEASLECNQMSWIDHGDHYGQLIRDNPMCHFLSSGNNLTTLNGAVSSHLVSLIIVTGGIKQELLKSLLTETDLPNLSHLDLWLGLIYYSDMIRSAMFRFMRDTLLSESENGYFPRLRYLGLRNSEQIDALSKLIPYAAITRRIQTLDLSNGTLSAFGVYRLIIGFEEVLQNCPTAFDHLVHLNLMNNSKLEKHKTISEEDYKLTRYDGEELLELNKIRYLLDMDSVDNLVEFCKQRESLSIHDLLYNTLGRTFVVNACPSERYMVVGE
jgi:hypothetical protein